MPTHLRRAGTPHMCWLMREVKIGRRGSGPGRRTDPGPQSVRHVADRVGRWDVSVLSDQLTAYQLVEPDAEQTALCVLVKTKEPKIEWHTAARSGEDLAEFLVKATIVARDIAASRFHKRPASGAPGAIICRCA